ncbi:MAG: YgaP family membrane protein [Bacillota bacterium]
MKVKQNIGIVNALIRITCGFTFLSWATAKMVKRPWKGSYLLVAFLSAMKIAEGIVRFCPVTALFEEGQEVIENNRQNSDREQTDAEEIVPHNPT